MRWWGREVDVSREFIIRYSGGCVQGGGPRQSGNKVGI